MLLVPTSRAQTVDWARQLGTSEAEQSRGVSVDGLGNVFISGFTRGSLDGTITGNVNAFVSKYDSSGNLAWTRQLGIANTDSWGVSADDLGNVFISGDALREAFVSKYDSAGNLDWTRQFPISGGTIRSRGVSADGLGNVYISGRVHGPFPGGTFSLLGDAFVAKYDSAGNLAWARQLGTSAADHSNSVSADGLGNVFISGFTQGNLSGISAGGRDAFVSKYDSVGSLIWTRQLGTSGTDESFGVSADGLGNAFISGKTNGNLGGANEGSNDTFVSKYDSAGNLAWTRQLGTSNGETSNGVSADGLGNVFISGTTAGSLDGSTPNGPDAFVAKYNTTGNLEWTRQFDSNHDESHGVSADGLGSVYISGFTWGSLGGASAGERDAFLIKVNDDPFVQGDYNNNGTVDAADYTVWRDTFGQTGSLLAADGNGDNTVDATDHAYWASRFGNTVQSSTAQTGSVPEPSALVTLLTALGMLILKHRITS